ncbi:hypothetical protein EZS27_017169 [termite gut metagenome]|uniref:Uncharacterized protein n=1 Tax=termite gut metagenome TaxID=433724 RepID=A0A5J4RKT3_9ZZZZ
MANFSSIERNLSMLLTKFPLSKQAIKRVYLFLNYLLFKKKYRFKIHNNSIDKIEQVYLLKENEESFFGYYDKSPLVDNKIISYISNFSTRKIPNNNISIKIVISSLFSDKCHCIATTKSYNWQQGCRAQWLSDNLLIYNDFDDKKGIYCSKIFSISQMNVVYTFDYPIQDSYKDKYFLSINYRRLMYLRPDYGYRNLPQLPLSEIKNYSSDGIWRIDIHTGSSCLVHSLNDIIHLEYKEVFNYSLHKVNHLMISPNGLGCIFIHRYYKNFIRYDRLIFSNYLSFKVLIDFGMVSHCCWISNYTIFGYLRYKSKDGFYFIDVETGTVSECHKLNTQTNGDGHPSSYKHFIVVDTYPDKSSMQKLLLYDFRNEVVYPLIEVFHGVNYNNQTRCDLHPRFSFDGRYVFFDTIYLGKRTHCRINVSHLTLNV